MSITASAVQVMGETPRILVTVVTSPAITDSVTVWRRHEDGSDHRVLTASTNNNVIGGSWVGYDFHAPFNSPVRYYAKAAGQAIVVSSPVVVISRQMWLIHPSEPDLSMILAKLKGPQASLEYAGRAMQFDVLNREDPVTVSAYPLGTPTSSFRFEVPRTDVPKVKALFADDSPLLMNGPWGDDDLGWEWFIPTAFSIINPAGHVTYPDRWVEVQYRGCSAMDTDTDPLWTAGDVKATFATAGAAKAAYADARAMKLDARV